VNVADQWSVEGYRHIRDLGAGAAGRVVLAVDEASGTPVAIKYLGDQIRRRAGFLERFRDEARLLAGLSDPNLVRFFEYVESPHGAAIVMELVDGVTLGEILKAEGATGPEAALVVLKGSLLGLAAAHAVGVVHRDYKPGNVLVRNDGTSKLADFGIAVTAGSEVGSAGTPAYMAPEQWSAGTVGPTADVYAATGVFYECLVGHRPYPAKEVVALAAAHMSAPIPVADVPEPLRPLVEHGLAKNPADRPRSARAFLAELEAVALAGYGPGWEERGRLRLAALAALLAFLYPLAEPAAVGGTALALTRLGRNRMAAVSGILVGALLAGGGGAYALASYSRHFNTTAKAASTLSAAPSASGPSVVPSDSANPSSSPEPTHSAVTPTPTPDSGTTVAPTSGTKTSSSPSPSATKKQPPKLKASVTGVSVAISLHTVQASVTITATGRGPVTVSGSFTVMDDAGEKEFGSDSSTIDVTDGQTYTVNLSASFRTCIQSASVTATTSAGGSGSGSARGGC
jgi:eukaryotic-like serine/threonine-protein kinase